jgi:hypothetical protein
MTVLVAVGVLVSFTSAQAALTTVFFDDFSGDLSGWDLNRMNGTSSLAIVGGQGVFDADSSERGMPTADVNIPSGAVLAPLAGAGNVALRIEVTAISAAHAHAGGVLIGVPEYVDGTEDINGVLSIDGMAGGGEYMLQWDVPGTLWTESGSGVWEAYGGNYSWPDVVANDVTRIDFITSDGVSVDTMKVYVNDVLGSTTLDSGDGELGLVAGQVGFYLNNDRDFTLDNVKIQIAPEPASLGLLGLGGLLMLGRRR